MSAVTITLTDNEDGTIMVGADFGDAISDDSTAHQMALVLLESVLKQSKTYAKIEDTVPQVDVEPKVIITGERNGV